MIRRLLLTINSELDGIVKRESAYAKAPGGRVGNRELKMLFLQRSLQTRHCREKIY